MKNYMKWFWSLISLAVIFSSSSVMLAQDTEANSQSITGVITDSDWFYELELEIETNSDVILDVVPTPNSRLDTLLRLVDRNNLIIAENDDRDAENGDYSSRIEMKHLAPGDYRVVVTRYNEAEGDSSGGFELVIESTPVETLPSLTITAEDLLENNYPVSNPNEPADWTIFAYYGADTNLEKGIMNDFNEFELAGGSSSRVRIVTLLDRHPGYATGSGDWSTARLFEIGADISGDESLFPDLPPTLDTAELADLGEIDTGNSRTLANFLIWGMENYPAENYALAFASHGAGWGGLIYDETGEKDILTIPDIQRAMESALEAAGRDKFDLLINDACLMSSVEYYAGIMPYFRLTLGSPELVTDPALDMTLFTQALQAGDVELSTVGRRLIDKYITEDVADNGNAPYYTGALTRLDGFDVVVNAVNDFAEYINRQPAVHSSAIGQARRNTYTYGAFVGLETEIDLGDFMTQLIDITGDPGVIERAEKVLEALDSVRLHSNAGQIAIQRASYYNIYFPASPSDFEDDYYERSPLDTWGQMLRNYYRAAIGDYWQGDGTAVTFHLPKPPDVTITSVIPDSASFDLPVSIAMEVIGTGIARGSFTIDRPGEDGNRIRYLQEPMLTGVRTADGQRVLTNQNVWRAGLDKRSLKWAATAYQVSDGNSTDFEFLQQSLDGQEVYFLDGRYRVSSEEDWQAVRIVFSPDPQRAYDLRSSSIISQSETGTVGVITAEPGAEFQAFQTLLDEDDQVQKIPGNVYTWSQDGLVSNLMPVASGDYLLSFEIQNYGGEITRASREIRVNNEGVNPNTRGQNFLEEWGIKGIVPDAWEDLQLSDNTMYINNYQFNVREYRDNYDVPMVLIYYVLEDETDGSQTALEDAMNTVIRYVRGDPDTASVLGMSTINDRDALEFRYEEDNRQIGNGAVVHIDESDTTYVVLAFEWRGDGSSAEQLYELVKAGTSFEDRSIYTQETASSWRFVNPFHEVEFPVRNTWDQDSGRSDEWIVYAPVLNSPTFGAFRVLDDDTITLQDLLSEVAPEADNIIEQTYYGHENTWDALEYIIEHDGLSIAGRVYLTARNDRLYAAWFETPAADAADTFANTLEIMLSGTRIYALYYVEDLAQELGITLYRPGPLIPGDTWGGRFYDSDVWRMYSRNSDGTQRVEVYEFRQPESSNLDGLIDLFTTERLPDSSIIDGPTLTQIDSRDVAEFDIVFEDWTGRYFVTYDEQRDLGLIVGARSIGEEYVDIYSGIRENMVFTPGAFYPLDSITQQSIYQTNYGFTVDVPSHWQAFTLDFDFEPSIDRYWTATSQDSIWVAIVDGASDDLRQIADDVAGARDGEGRLEITGDFNQIEVAGRPALEFTGIDTGLNDRPGIFFVVYDEKQERGYVIGFLSAWRDVNSIEYQGMKESFEILSPDGES